MPHPPRLIDLHCDWLLQYAGESIVFDGTLYEGVGGRVGQAEGYLSGVAAAVLACYRRQEDWAKQADPWRALGDLITRVEAEFPGRVLAGPDDLARWRDEPDGLCWAVIGVEGFDALVREAEDLDRLPALFARGVRVFQPVYSADNALGGSASGGDDRGLMDLGRAFLAALAELAPDARGPRSAVDLAHLNPAAASGVLDWFEADPSRGERVLPVYSHGALRFEGFDSPRAITPENLARLRALGGLVGFTPAFYPTADALRAGIETAAALPFRGRPGFEGLAIGTDFLGIDETLPGLEHVEGVVGWALSTFPREAADALLVGNARALLGRLAGAGADAPPGA
jgi:membrane dipeptidase